MWIRFDDLQESLIFEVFWVFCQILLQAFVQPSVLLRSAPRSLAAVIGPTPNSACLEGLPSQFFNDEEGTNSKCAGLSNVQKPRQNTQACALMPSLSCHQTTRYLGDSETRYTLFDASLRQPCNVYKDKRRVISLPLYLNIFNKGDQSVHHSPNSVKLSFFDLPLQPPELQHACNLCTKSLTSSTNYCFDRKCHSRVDSGQSQKWKQTWRPNVQCAHTDPDKLASEVWKVAGAEIAENCRTWTCCPIQNSWNGEQLAKLLVTPSYGGVSP